MNHSSQLNKKITELITVEQATIDDVSAISQVHSKVFLRQIESELWIQSNLSAYPRIIIFKALWKNNIVGYIQWIFKSGFRTDAIIELEQIAVLPSMQRKGIGSKLIVDSLEKIKLYLSSETRTLKGVLISSRTDNHAQKIYHELLSAKPIVIIPKLYSEDEVIMYADFSIKVIEGV